MAAEQNLWRWLKRETQSFSAAKRLHICRVENPVGPGYPDVEGCLNGHNFHLELKAAPRPKRDSTPVKVHMRQKQIHWLKKRWEAGGSCWVLLRIGERNKTKHYLIPGGKTARLGKLTEHEIGKLSCIDAEYAPSGIEILRSALRD